MASLHEFVLGLSRDPQRVEAFKRDPDGVMSDAELSEDDKELLRSGDVDRIRSAIMPDSPEGEQLPITVITMLDTASG